jgi:hypothetical protein
MLCEEVLENERACPTLDKSRALFWSVLALGTLLYAQGYCAGNEVQEIEAMTTNVMNTIFSPWVKKTALVFGGGAGLFQAYAAGSIKPLLLWGGLGLAVNYVPKLVEIIGGI